MGALAIGFGAGLICYYAVELIHKTRLDDALDDSIGSNTVRVLYIFSACCNNSMERRGGVETSKRSVATSRSQHHASIIPQCTWAACTGPTMQSELHNVMGLAIIFL